MSSEDGEDGYVHTPDAAADAESGEQGGPSGWLLVGVVTLATLVLPGIVYLYPSLLADRVPFFAAMLAVPLLPALLLGVVGVWAMAE